MATGIQSTGFIRPTLADLLDQTEQKNVEVFGPGLVQTPQTPMGQINGLIADLTSELWEIALEVYQSYDPDQSEGIPLERLARLRLLERAPGESDAALAQAVTNAGVAKVRDADFYRSVLNLDGVTFVRIYANDTGEVDADGMDPHSVCVVALGGDDEEIATTARRYIVPGISSFGNTMVSTNVDGFCRSIRIMRPTIVPIEVEVEVIKRADRNGCPPPSNTAIAETMVMNLSGSSQVSNGEDVTAHLIQTAISCVYPSVEVVAVSAARDGGLLSGVPLLIGFDEIAEFAIARTSVVVA